MHRRDLKSRIIEPFILKYYAYVGHYVSTCPTMAAPEQLRLVFLDDNHPIMEYSDGWSLSVLTPAEEPQSFTPLYDSLHVTTHSPSSTRYNVSFTFDGGFDHCDVHQAFATCR